MSPMRVKIYFRNFKPLDMEVYMTLLDQLKCLFKQRLSLKIIQIIVQNRLKRRWRLNLRLCVNFWGAKIEISYLQELGFTNLIRKLLSKKQALWLLEARLSNQFLRTFKGAMKRGLYLLTTYHNKILSIARKLVSIFQVDVVGARNYTCPFKDLILNNFQITNQTTIPWKYPFKRATYNLTYLLTGNRLFRSSRSFKSQSNFTVLQATQIISKKANWSYLTMKR